MVSMDLPNDSVVAVVVTYNRSSLLVECLCGLLRQSRPLQRIIVIDNASTDGTPVVLSSAGLLDDELIDYVRLDRNTGGAGGFHEGMRRGVETGAAWVWVMDDDAEPRVDALERMSHALTDAGTVGVASLPVDRSGKPQYGHRGWNCLCGTSREMIKRVEDRDLTADIVITSASFVGLAVRSAAIRQIGLPRRELFIHYDDFEYCTRLAKIGEILLVPSSVIVHKDGAFADAPSKTVGARSSIRVPIAGLWLRYYSLRNLVWLRKANCGSFVAMLFSLRAYVRIVAGVLLYDDHKLLRLKFWFQAIADGWRGVFDNDKPRLLTRTGS